MSLPELQTGDIVMSKTGRRYAIVRVPLKRQQRDTGYDEPIYRLRSLTYDVIGDREWTLDELVAEGIRISDNKKKETE